ncbi:hypothetical protein L2E82_30040 [Cichorium intybus]|uniref:Uncharacterized protein n=1 Tax=Cichorium intybus TaxID=13427 RepID=A0ACB9CZF9_CICIN|nr:hypothetical protein L2E82_30040 [Cichorium intybus]
MSYSPGSSELVIASLIFLGALLTAAHRFKGKPSIIIPWKKPRTDYRTVYKGTIRGGPEIAVISLSNQEENWTSYLELYFQKEVADLARLNQEHIGKPQTFIWIACLANQRARSMVGVRTPSYRHLPAGTIVPWLCP